MDTHLEEKPACSVNKAVVPLEIICTGCGTEIEIWSDETEVKCKCGIMVCNEVSSQIDE